MKILLWSFISLLLSVAMQAQVLKFTQLRLGVDPVFSSSSFFPRLDPKSNLIVLRNYEFNAELIGNYRISFAAEAGHSSMSLWLLNATEIYYVDGYYARIGCNFDLIEPSPNKEFDLGWRLGLSSFTEHANVYLKGENWKNDVSSELIPRTNSVIWGSMLIEYKFRVFSNSKSTFKNVWLGASLRVNINPSMPDNSGYRTQYIPGMGLNFLISPSAQFSLSYAIHFTKAKIHKAYHLNHHYDIIRDNIHHVYKIKEHRVDADEIKRE